MSKIIPLANYPIRPVRQMGESLVGYVYRFLSTNGYEFRVKHYELIVQYLSQVGKSKKEIWKKAYRFFP